jgi:hypothetical protein
MMTIVVKLVDTDKLAGWVRAGVAALFGAAASWFGGELVPFLTPDMQTAVGVVLSTIVVGVWSHIAKSVSGQNASG